MTSPRMEDGQPKCVKMLDLSNWGLFGNRAGSHFSFDARVERVKVDPWASKGSKYVALGGNNVL